MDRVSESANYMRQNPSIVAGIDGYANPRGTDAYSLSPRRVATVRDALIEAGVQASRIVMLLAVDQGNAERIQNARA